MTQENSEPGSRKSLIKRIRTHLKNLNSGKRKPGYDSKDYDNLDTSRQNMIRGVFELPDHIARDLMIPRVDIVAIDSKIELKPLVKKVYEAGHSRLPVYDDTIDNIIGILYAKDLLKVLIDKPKKFNIKKIVRDAYYVPETMPLDELLFEFQKRKHHMAIVVDEYGGVGGVLTLEDILEEIVGDIVDEYDSEMAPEFVELGNGSYEVDSRMTLYDFNEKLGVELPVEDFDTIGGFVFDLFGKIPKLNEQAAHGNMTFKINKIKGTVINRIGLKVE